MQETVGVKQSKIVFSTKSTYFHTSWLKLD